jgi:hypothetical protein
VGKLDANLETYRAMAETMQLLRRLVREVLRQAHGEEWQERGIPPAIHGFLSQRREREASIQWRLAADVDLLDFAGFENLGETILADPDLSELFATVAGGRDLLRGRFIELDTIQARVAYVRPLSDAELEFVVSFNERLRKVDLERRRPPASLGGNDPQHRTAAAAGTALSAPSAGGGGGGSEPTPALDHFVPARSSAPPVGGGEASTGDTKVTRKALAAALAKNETVTVLTALYQEVTGLAEALWVDARVAASPAWDAVRESKWYGVNFSKLGLKVVSDFYDTQRSIADLIASGADSSTVRQTLQERRFGELLLALRELFKRHLVRDPAPPGKSPYTPS